MRSVGSVRVVRIEARTTPLVGLATGRTHPLDGHFVGVFDVGGEPHQLAHLVGVGTDSDEFVGGAVRQKVPYSAYLFYKWAAEVDPEYGPDPYGEAVNPAQIVEQARAAGLQVEGLT